MSTKWKLFSLLRKAKIIRKEKYQRKVKYNNANKTDVAKLIGILYSNFQTILKQVDLYVLNLKQMVKLTTKK